MRTRPALRKSILIVRATVETPKIVFLGAESLVVLFRIVKDVDPIRTVFQIL